MNYYRRGKGEWTVSSELSMEMSPGAVESLLSAPDEPVVASARPLGPTGATWLSVCTLSHRGRVIGGRYLGVFSTEVERSFARRWAVARRATGRE